VTNRAALTRLFTSNPDVWLTRSQIVEVAGDEATRRLRELRDGGMYIEYEPGRGYRYTPSTGTTNAEWRCAKCGVDARYELQPSTDTRDRWRLGKCAVCKQPNATFERARPAKGPAIAAPAPAQPDPELPGSDPLHPFADPRPDWADGS
jgi:hypothetical protein